MFLYSERWHGCRFQEFGWRRHRLIVLENELLRLSVIASKGADILEFRYKPEDLDVLWHAPQPLIDYVPTRARDAGAFMDYYAGGWQECFPSGGNPCNYRGAQLGAHGEVTLMPWDVRVKEDSPSRIAVEFSVECMRTPFRLERLMILESNQPAVRLQETIVNLGEERLHYGWGHHPAFGPPFLQAGCVLDLPRCKAEVPAYALGLRRRLQSGSQRLDDVRTVLDKSSRTEDVVLFSELADGWAALRNPMRKLAIGLTWDRSVFPYVWNWQVYGGSFGSPYFGRTHTFAIEPFNTPIITLEEAATHGLAPELAPGERRRGFLEIGIIAAEKPIVSLVPRLKAF